MIFLKDNNFFSYHVVMNLLLSENSCHAYVFSFDCSKLRDKKIIPIISLDLWDAFGEGLAVG